MGSPVVANSSTRSRRFLTLLFSDLSGSSTLASWLEHETLAQLLLEVHRVVAEAVARHGGRVVRTQGDGSLAVFGYPSPNEHDARHACEAALEAHAAVADLPALRLPGGPQRLALHSGVHSGLVHVSPGDGARGELDLVGDAANTAARLAGCAGRGGLLADVDSLGPELPFFEIAGIAELSLPGRAVPVRAARILGVSALRRRIDVGRTVGLSPLLGREEALAALLRACVEAEDERRFIEVRGPAGIGKSRLLDELATRLSATRVAVLRGGCESYGIAPVLEPFRQLLAAHTTEAQAQDDSQLRQRALRFLLTCDDGSHALLLDDWQWADEASRKLLDDVLRATSALRVVVASREAGDADSRATVSLRPLSADETRRIVQAWAPGTSPFIVDELHEYTGGVPLFVEETCHMLRHRGEAGWHAFRHHGPRAGSGNWMKSMIAARVDRLGDRAWDTVHAAAVVGIRAPLALLESLVPCAIDGAVLRQLDEMDLLSEDGAGTLRFRHGLSRDAVYELIPLDRRVALHKRLLALLAGGPATEPGAVERLEALAHHARCAGDWPRASDHCEAAADEATRLGAFDSARRQYLAAIEAAEFAGIESAPARSRWCTLVHRLAMTCMFDPLASPEALPLVERCVESARTLGGEVLARSLYWNAYLHYVFGQPRRALPSAEEARELAAALGSERLLAQIDATLGQVLAAVGHYPQALQALDKALRTKQKQSSGSGALAIGSAFAYACLASVHGDRGDFDAAGAALAKARGFLTGQPNHPVANSVSNWEMVVLAWQQRWTDVLPIVQATSALARRSRALLPLAIARAVGGYARWRLHRDPDAIAEAEEAVRWLENHRVLFFTTIYYGWLVEMSVETGRFDEARRWASALLQRSRAGEHLGEAVAWRALARAALVQGDHPRAWRRLAHAERSARRRDSSREAALNALLHAQLLRVESRAEEAAPIEAQARERLRAMGIEGEG